jgi:phosphate starvation-inducible PhoH-like protein
VRKTVNRKILNFAADADNSALANLTGALDGNLRQIETELDVEIKRRGHQFRIEGDATQAQQAVAVLEHFLGRASRPISIDDIQLYFVELRGGGAPQAPAANDGERLPELHTRRRDLHGRTPRQRDYIEAILGHDISFGIGPAGTGKTYLAVACAVDALERSAVERIVLTRPAVEAGERLGFLPGDLTQKVDPYLRPLYDALFDLLGFEKTQRLLERQTIEIAPLAYMRGRTLNQAFVILDEAQNTTPEQMKMFLTRIGFGSKAVITGDVTQIDLPRGNSSGLIEAQHVLNDVRGIAFTYFTAADVVRHPLVARIVEAYEAAEKLNPPAARGGMRPRSGDAS